MQARKEKCEDRSENARNQSLAIDAAKQLRSADLQFDKQAKLNAELAKTKKWQEEIAKVNPADPLISAEANAKREEKSENTLRSQNQQPPFITLT
jgi:hypothetical protein